MPKNEHNASHDNDNGIAKRAGRTSDEAREEKIYKLRLRAVGRECPLE